MATNATTHDHDDVDPLYERLLARLAAKNTNSKDADLPMRRKSSDGKKSPCATAIFASSDDDEEVEIITGRKVDSEGSSRKRTSSQTSVAVSPKMKVAKKQHKGLAIACSVISCPCTLSVTGAWARIRINPPDVKKIRQFKGSRPLINWKDNGIADLCWSCFEAVREKRCPKSAKEQEKETEKKTGEKKKRKMIAQDKPCFGKFEQRATFAVVETAEMWDSEDDVNNKANTLAKLLMDAKQHVMAFTGAGISTSAGIGDYRGLMGKWTEDAMDLHQDDDSVETADEGVPYEKLRPTFTHEALSHMVQNENVNYVVSQNCDGLHLLSGIPKSKISELHGNVFQEYCENCKKEYERKQYVCFDGAEEYFSELAEFGKTKTKKPPKDCVPCDGCQLNHRTLKKCPACKGHLRDTIINFGDQLRPHIWDPAEEHSKRATVYLACGSTLAVTPACELVQVTFSPSTRQDMSRDAKPTKQLVIINRQSTELDDCASLVIHADTDKVFHKVMTTMMGEKGVDVFVNKLKSKAEKYNEQRICDY